jgi:hypothetical protein
MYTRNTSFTICGGGGGGGGEDGVSVAGEVDREVGGEVNQER